ncbi:cupin domain-containing protein [Streptomyces sp. NPDC057638]|uniref:cupin domain-containing protein n=1 Tax=Streptomyces sp. NPDC057638 TaxID=3346190 RepID=UPI0036BF138F
MRAAHPTVAELTDLYGLEPLPEEGGLFRRTWAGPDLPDGHPAGSAIVVLLTADGDHFSALHRLPTDEIWHFYLGDPVQLLLLGASARTVALGPGVLDGQYVQFTVPAGTWMGGAVADGGDWALMGCTMAPGFHPDDYEGGDAEELSARYPEVRKHIRSLCRARNAR